MSDVLDLAHFARARDLSSNTALASAPAGDSAWFKQIDSVATGGGSLSAAVLRKLNVDSELGRFIDLVHGAIERLIACQELMRSEDSLAADDQFIACKPIFVEMLMFRELSDTVGLIALKCFQLVGSVQAVTDTPALPSLLERVLTRVRMAPFMKFEEACALSDELERVVNLEPVPGFAEISNALVEEASQSVDAHDHD